MSQIWIWLPAAVESACIVGLSIWSPNNTGSLFAFILFHVARQSLLLRSMNDGQKGLVMPGV